MATPTATPSPTLPAGAAPYPPSVAETTSATAELVAHSAVRQSGSGSIAVPVTSEFSSGSISPLFERLPVSLIVAVPVRDFRVKNLLAIAPGAVIETQWNHGEDLPLSSGSVQLAWSEFEVVDTRLAVRVTRLT